MCDTRGVVWLIEEQVYGRIVSLGAFFSMVQYTTGGIDYEVLIENEDFEIREDNFD